MRPGNRIFLKAILPGLALICASSVPGWASPPLPEIAWVDNLDQAKQLAKTHNKPLMIHFYGDHCPPCRMLEAKAFRNRDLVSVLNDHVIATKVNADKQREVAQYYQVNRWPTDVFLHADGTVIERSVSNQDPQAYARTVERVSQRHQDWALAAVAEREMQDRRGQHSGVRGTSMFQSMIFGASSRARTPVKVSSKDWGNQEPLPPHRNPVPSSAQVIRIDQHIQGIPSERTGDLLNRERGPSSESVALASQPGMGGFCPVALQDYLKMSPDFQATHSPWIQGQDAFTIRHRGRIYRCASEESRQRMLQDPDAFAPVFSGLDLVEFARSGSLVSGQCELGFIEQNSGKVFLFSTRTNYEEFLRNCDRYSAIGEEPGRERLAHDPNSSSFR
jgi:thiol-disulfide isomerase/thioredoxin